MGSTYSWFESYLFSRQQCASFQGCLSEWGAVYIGVPQGSILGPLLFSIYVNDLFTVVRLQMNMYADDTKLHLSGHDHDLLSVQHDFQCDLDAIHACLCHLTSLKCHKVNCNA